MWRQIMSENFCRFTWIHLREVSVLTMSRGTIEFTKRQFTRYSYHVYMKAVFVPSMVTSFDVLQFNILQDVLTGGFN